MIQPPYVKDGTQIADKVVIAARHIVDLSITALQIAAGTITNAKMANMAAGTVKAAPTGGAAAPVDLSIVTAGHFPLGNGTDVTNGVMSGDATMSGTGVVTIANAAVTAPKIGTLPGARVWNSADMGVNDVTDTLVLMDTNLENDNNMHSTVTNNARLTVNTAGVYEITGCVAWAAGTASLTGTTKLIKLVLNGTTIIAGAQTGDAAAPIMIVSTTRRFVATDYVTLTVRIATGATGTLIVKSFSEYSPILCARWIST